MKTNLHIFLATFLLFFVVPANKLRAAIFATRIDSIRIIYENQQLRITSIIRTNRLILSEPVIFPNKQQ